MEPSTRKEKRIESKKRKAKAFLELTKQIEEVDNQLKDTDEECGSSKQPKIAEVKKGQNKSMDEWAQYKKLLREKKKASMEKPKIYLILDDLQFQHSRQASQDLTFKEMPPLFILDLQHLLLFALQGNVSSYKPRWCKLLRGGKITSVVVIVMDSVSSQEFQTYPDCFPRLKGEFDMSADMVCPEQYGSSVCEDLFNVPLSNSVLYKLHGRIPSSTMKMIKQFTKTPIVKPVQKKQPERKDKEKVVDIVTDEKGIDIVTDQKVVDVATDNQDEEPLSTGFTNADVDEVGGDIHQNDCFTRTSLLLSSSQMIAEDLPLPIQYNKLGTYTDFVFSRDSYTTVTSQSPMFAVDCEMVITSVRKFELARVSVINESLETVYDTFVKPYNKVVDYVSRYSGVTKFILDPVKTRIEDVQKFFRTMLPPDAILCGQSLKGDLTALKMFHPYVIDTSVIFNLSGHRSQKTGLKRLAAHFLGKEIQESDEGHSSVEDAVTTMELVQLKLKQSPDYGDIVIGGSIHPQSVKDGKNDSSTDKQDNTTTSGQCTEDNNTKQDNTTPSSQCTEENKTKVEGGDDSKSCVHNETEISENMKDITQNDSTKDEKCSDSKSEINCTCDNKTETDSAVKCKSCQKKMKEIKDKENLIQQRKAFFQQAGSQVYDSFFKLMQKHNKMVGLIDRKDTLETYKADNMTSVPTQCDRDTKSAGKSLTQFHDFVYMNFPSYRDMLDNSDEEEKQKLLRKQDKRISKVLKHVRTNSLVAIVMSGRCTDGQDYNARTFVKIT